MKRSPIVLSIAALALSSVAICLSIVDPSFPKLFGGAILNRSCGEIVYGNVIPSTAASDTNGYSKFTSSGMPDFSIASSGYVARNLDAVNEPLRLGSSSKAGAITISFTTPQVVTKAIIYACAYGTQTVSTLPNYVLTVSSSAETTGTTFAMSSSNTAVDISDTSNDGYIVEGLDGGNGVASSSITIAENEKYRIYLCKIVLSIADYSPVDSSQESSVPASSSSSSSASPSSSSSSSSSSSQSGAATNTSQYWSEVTDTSYSGNFIDYSPATTYRIAPKVSEDGTKVDLFSVSELNGNYYMSVARTIYKNEWYVDSEDVAAYYNAFKSFPTNYVHYNNSEYHGSDTATSAKKEAFNTYGTKGRLYTEYKRTTGYVTSMPDLYMVSSSDFFYIEVDLAVTSSYASSTNFNRGSGRLVVFPYGMETHQNEPFITQTLDHYGHFREFANYYGGWGANFLGQTTSAPTEPYSALQTVVPSLA